MAITAVDNETHFKNFKISEQTSIRKRQLLCEQASNFAARILIRNQTWNEIGEKANNIKVRAQGFTGTV